MTLIHILHFIHYFRDLRLQPDTKIDQIKAASSSRICYISKRCQYTYKHKSRTATLVIILKQDNLNVPMLHCI